MTRWPHCVGFLLAQVGWTNNLEQRDLDFFQTRLGMEPTDMPGCCLCPFVAPLFSLSLISRVPVLFSCTSFFLLTVVSLRSTLQRRFSNKFAPAPLPLRGLGVPCQTDCRSIHTHTHILTHLLGRSSTFGNGFERELLLFQLRVVDGFGGREGMGHHRRIYRKNMERVEVLTLAMVARTQINII